MLGSNNNKISVLDQMPSQMNCSLLYIEELCSNISVNILLNMFEIIFQNILTQFPSTCIVQSVFKKFCSLFENKFSSQCDLILSLSSLFFILPSVTCFKMQFLHRMRPIQLAFLCFIVCRMLLSFLTPCNATSFFTQSDCLLHPSKAPHFKFRSHSNHKNIVHLTTQLVQG